MIESTTIQQKFTELFQSEPHLFRAPGRVNLIGEHTDYNDGFVLPAAINKEMKFAIATNDKDEFRFFAIDLNESYSVKPDELKYSESGWPNYLMGVIDQFNQAGSKIPTFDCVFGGDIPNGAGLSSSAALECGLAFGLNQIFDLGFEKFELVKLAQRAENDFVGVKCGIMDQFASMYGKFNSVIKLDCRSLDYEYFDFNLSEYRIVLCDTQVKHSLASSEYNTRRQECEEGVKILQQAYPEVQQLRDADLSMLQQLEAQFDPVIFKRCRYVVQENERVGLACQDLEKNDLVSFGKRMYESHHGLQYNYEVSCKELDFLVEKAKQSEYVLGARMMGGGFGGCTINLVHLTGLEKFHDFIVAAYKNEMGLELKQYVVQIENGTSSL